MGGAFTVIRGDTGGFCPTSRFHGNMEATELVGVAEDLDSLIVAIGVDRYQDSLYPRHTRMTPGVAHCRTDPKLMFRFWGVGVRPVALTAETNTALYMNELGKVTGATATLTGIVFMIFVDGHRRVLLFGVLFPATGGQRVGGTILGN